MPDSCAKAFAPTIALFGCTGYPVIVETSFEAGTIWVASIRVVHGKKSERVFTAMTISSSDALPARSPRPLSVHSTCLAPAITAASELATAMPRSLWQLVDQIALSALGMREMRLLKSPAQSSGTL